MKKRKVIQMQPDPDTDAPGVWLLCGDGSLWFRYYSVQDSAVKFLEVDLSPISADGYKHDQQS